MKLFKTFNYVIFFDGTSFDLMDIYAYNECEYKNELKPIKAFNMLDLAADYTEELNQ